MMRLLALVTGFSLLVTHPVFGGEAREVKVTVLSTMLADSGFGEWGYSALVEVDGKKVLFDTGANPDTVLEMLGSARNRSFGRRGCGDFSPP